MSSKNHFILMADIVASRRKKQMALMRAFSDLVADTNNTYGRIILSPLTITLGDEFQGIFKKLSHALEVFVYLEESRISRNLGFELRYVIAEGRIETPVNTKVAHGMMGEGLSRAREMLTALKTAHSNFRMDIADKELETALSDATLIFNGITAEWDPSKDHEIISAFLHKQDYKAVAEQLDKDRAQMWRKEKSLRISQYLASKALIKYLGSK